MRLDPPQHFFTVELNPLSLFTLLGQQENRSFVILYVDGHPGGQLNHDLIGHVSLSGTHRRQIAGPFAEHLNGKIRLALDKPQLLHPFADRF